MTSPQARKGGAFEFLVAGYLTDQLGTDLVKRPRVTTADVGDIHAGPACIECKCYPTRMAAAIGDAMREVPAECRNAGLTYPVGVVKRPRVTDAADQLVVMNLSTFVDLLRETL